MPLGFDPPHPGGMAENSPYGELPIRAIMGTYGRKWGGFVGILAGHVPIISEGVQEL
jgi:hypothetical protein